MPIPGRRARPTAAEFLAELTAAYPAAADLSEWLPAGMLELSARHVVEAGPRPPTTAAAPRNPWRAPNPRRSPRGWRPTKGSRPAAMHRGLRGRRTAGEGGPDGCGGAAAGGRGAAAGGRGSASSPDAVPESGALAGPAAVPGSGGPPGNQWYSPLRQPEPRRRRRWLWAAGAAALCAVVVVAVVFSLGSSDPERGPRHHRPLAEPARVSGRLRHPGTWRWPSSGSATA